MALSAIREFFPVGPNHPRESDLAAGLRLELLAEIVTLVGPDRFMKAVKQAMSLSRSRFDCTVLKIRECAGLYHIPEVSPALRAWGLVTLVVQKHVRRAPEGYWRLEPHFVVKDGAAEVVPAPEIPEPVKKAVQALGGWDALATCPAEFWSQRMRDFCNLYEEGDPK